MASSGFGCGSTESSPHLNRKELGRRPRHTTVGPSPGRSGYSLAHEFVTPAVNVQPVTLEAEYIRLESLSLEDHLDDLQAAGSDPSIFRWFADDYSTPAGMRTFVTEALAAQEAGTAHPFATVLQETGEVIGSTRFCNIRPDSQRVEIGWTWLTSQQQRTPANTEAKYLMLRHAFEQWDCVRVEFETAAGNERSREALERIGATEEGVLRKHMLIQGTPQDGVFFSILDTEWPAVKRDLEAKMDRSFSE
jgi:RimJ/RimL family protein N-acetyltransferase